MLLDGEMAPTRATRQISQKEGGLLDNRAMPIFLQRDDYVDDEQDGKRRSGRKRNQNVGNGCDCGGGGGGDHDVQKKNSDGKHSNDNNLDGNNTIFKNVDQPNHEYPPPSPSHPPPVIVNSPVVMVTSEPEVEVTASLLPPERTITPEITVASLPAHITSTLTSVSIHVTTISMTTWISMTATATATIDGTISSQPRKGLDPPFFPTPIPDSEPTSIETTPFAATAGAESSDDGGKDHDHDSAGGLDPTAEHLLIAAGSIGAFILFCFIGWIIYRTIKKSKHQKQMHGDSYDGGFLNNLPWRKDRGSEPWDRRGPPPSYKDGDSNSMQDAGFYGPEKMYQSRSELSRSKSGASQRSFMPQGLAPGSVIMIPVEQYAAMSHSQSPTSGNETVRTQDGWYNQPELARQLEGSQNQSTLASTDSSLRSRMPDPFFNQSELARQPSDAHNPARRQVYRASELSSISSGFGDGDIIVPDSLVKPPQASMPMRQSNNFVGRFSWMSRGAGDRETVYTTTSEDRPAKYRTVTSWVNQQAGRMKRADAKKKEAAEIPAVPDLSPQTNSS